MAEVYAADIYTAEMHARPSNQEGPRSCSDAEIAAEVASLLCALQRFLMSFELLCGGRFRADLFPCATLPCSILIWGLKNDGSWAECWVGSGTQRTAWLSAGVCQTDAEPGAVLTKAKMNSLWNSARSKKECEILGLW